jgi:hypothetical protein
MADRKISDLTALTTPASGDYLPIVDISEGAAASKNKRVTIESLFQGIPVNVGIGTTSPSEMLTIAASLASNGPTIRLETTGAFATPDQRIGALDFYNSDADIAGVAAYVRVLAGSSFGVGGKLVFGTQETWSTGVLRERMRIDESGRVGIGTTSPGSLLHLADAGDITVGTTTGTKIGTATTQKIGFYNATPVVQPTAVADATDAATVITQLNALLTRMRNLGLIAT